MKALRSYSSPAGTATLYNFRNLDEKLRYMRSMIEQARENPIIRVQSLQIIEAGGCRRGDKRDQALTIGQWVQDNCFYVHEMPERLSHAHTTLMHRAGDCDDFTILIGGLIETIGIPCVQVCMELDGLFKHIFPAAIMERKNWRAFLPLDATMKNPVKSVYNPIKWATERGRNVRLKLA